MAAVSLACPICMLDFNADSLRPVLCTACGKTMCKSCVQGVIKTHGARSPCPFCRQLLHQPLVYNRLVEDLVCANTAQKDSTTPPPYEGAVESSHPPHCVDSSPLDQPPKQTVVINIELPQPSAPYNYTQQHERPVPIAETPYRPERTSYTSQMAPPSAAALPHNSAGHTALTAPRRPSATPAPVAAFTSRSNGCCKVYKKNIACGLVVLVVAAVVTLTCVFVDSSSGSDTSSDSSVSSYSNSYSSSGSTGGSSGPPAVPYKLNDFMQADMSLNATLPDDYPVGRFVSRNTWGPSGDWGNGPEVRVSSDGSVVVNGVSVESPGWSDDNRKLSWSGEHSTSTRATKPHTGDITFSADGRTFSGRCFFPKEGVVGWFGKRVNDSS